MAPAHIGHGSIAVSYTHLDVYKRQAVTGDVRGALGFDGFRNSFALIGYAIPTDKGLSVQFLYSDDSSYDYWTNELNHICLLYTSIRTIY